MEEKIWSSKTTIIFFFNENFDGDVKDAGEIFLHESTFVLFQQLGLQYEFFFPIVQHHYISCFLSSVHAHPLYSPGPPPCGQTL